jgi:hypothetical protein
MKVQNKYVKIKTKDKEIVLHNYIFDNYLALFSKGQYTADEEISSKKFLGSCYLKFENTTFKSNVLDATLPVSFLPQVKDFDLKIEFNQYSITGSDNRVEITYTYETKEDLSQYYGKKIKGIGFAPTYKDELMAYIDTSAYSIYIPKDKKFNITRKDIFSSEAYCDGYEYPVHLAPHYKYENKKTEKYEEPLAILYSVGLGRQRGIMQEEYLRYNDFNVIAESDTVWGVNFKIDKSQNKYPRAISYPSSNKYPVKFYADREIRPNKQLFPNNSKYPLASNYNYVIYRYRLYYIDYSMGGGGVIIYTDKYYTMSYPIGRTTGLFEIKNKIERKN